MRVNSEYHQPGANFSSTLHKADTLPCRPSKAAIIFQRAISLSTRYYRRSLSRVDFATFYLDLPTACSFIPFPFKDFCCNFM